MRYIEKLKKSGLRVKLLSDNKIGVEPANKITPELRQLIKTNKEAIVKELKEAYTYQGHDYDYDRVCKILTALLKQYGGYVLVKSSILEEVIAFCLPQHLKALTKHGYTCYLPSELATLLIKQPQPEGFRKAHETKKIFNGKLALQ